MGACVSIAHMGADFVTAYATCFGLWREETGVGLNTKFFLKKNLKFNHRDPCGVGGVCFSLFLFFLDAETTVNRWMRCTRQRWESHVHLVDVSVCVTWQQQ